MTAASTSARGQIAAQRLMPDACRLFRRGQYAYDPAVGKDTAKETDLYVGKCRLRPQGRLAHETESSGSPVGVWLLVVQIPLSVTNAQLGDLLTITTSADPDLVGKTVRVQGIDQGTHVTARRLTCGLESR